MTHWLAADFLDWPVELESSSLAERAAADRPYQLLSHAEGLAVAVANEFATADAVLNLKRAINVRLQHLDRLYAVNQCFPGGVGALERLEALGLVRPLLIRKLFHLRNTIEHDDAPPPDLDRCRELIDSTWYFLRTTDAVCRTVPSSVVFGIRKESDWDPHLWVSVDFDFAESSSVQLRGWLPKQALLSLPSANSLGFDALEIRGKPSVPPPDSDEIDRFAYLKNSARGDDERYVAGTAPMPSDMKRKLLKCVFEAI